jgi:hypothetical protein
VTLITSSFFDLITVKLYGKEFVNGVTRVNNPV